jgi:hypothetical protein
VACDNAIVQISPVHHVVQQSEPTEREFRNTSLGPVDDSELGGFSYVRIVSFQVAGPEMALRARTKTFPLGSKVTFPFGNMTPALREAAPLDYGLLSLLIICQALLI